MRDMRSPGPDSRSYALDRDQSSLTRGRIGEVFSKRRSEPADLPRFLVRRRTYHQAGDPRAPAPPAQCRPHEAQPPRCRFGHSI
jgi:hypothetical protein